jgi:hypothetical protein
VARFPGVSLAKAGSVTLTAAATGLPTATSASFTIRPLAASQIAVASGNNQTAIAGAAVTLPLVVKVSDTFGNGVSGVAVSFAVASGGGTVGTPSATTDATGQAQSALTLGLVAGAQTVTATSAGLTGSPVTFTATGTLPLPQKLVFTAGLAAAGSTFPTLVVQAQDNAGHLAFGFTGPVSLSLSGGAAGAALIGTTTMNAVGGVATFSGLSVVRAATGYAITAASPGLSSATSSTFDITVGTPANLTFTATPSDGAAGAAFSPTPEVTVTDAFGNTVPSFTGTVTLALGTAPSGAALAGSTSVSAVAGVARFPGVSLAKAGSVTLTAAATGLPTATSASFTIRPLAASQIAVAGGNNQSAVAGAAVTLPLVAKVSDTFGNGVSGVIVSFAVASGGGTVGTPSATTDATGQAQTALTLGLVVGAQTVTATSAGLTGSPVTFTATGTLPLPQKLVFTTGPTSATAGATLPNIVVQVQDAAGDFAFGFTGPVTLAVGGGTAGAVLSGTATVNAVGGVTTFSGLSIALAGKAYTLTASASGPPNATSAAFDINAGPATKLVFIVPPTSTSIDSVIVPPPKVAAQDALGNTVTTFTGTIALSLTGTGGGNLAGATSIAAVAGVAAFPYLAVTHAGTGYVMGASTTGLTSATSAPFDVRNGRPSIIAVNPSSYCDCSPWIDGQVVTAGTNFNITVLITDALGTPLPNEPITFTASGDGNANPSSTTTNGSGVATFRWTIGGAAGLQTLIIGGPRFAVTKTLTVHVPVAPVSWTGHVSSDWNTAGNWASGHVPTSTDAVVIAGCGDCSEPPMPVLGTNVTVGSLTIGAYGSLLLGANLNVGGDVSIASNAGSTAYDPTLGWYVVAGSGTVTIGGNYTDNANCECYVWLPSNTVFTGVNKTLYSYYGDLYSNLTFNGSATMTSDIYAGSVTVSGAGAKLDGGGYELDVNGDFATANGGVLRMTNDHGFDWDPYFYVFGNVTFGGGSTAGLLKDRTFMEFFGNFTQSGAPDSFAPDGTVGTVFYNTGTWAPPPLGSARASSSAAPARSLSPGRARQAARRQAALARRQTRYQRVLRLQSARRLPSAVRLQPPPTGTAGAEGVLASGGSVSSFMSPSPQIVTFSNPGSSHFGELELYYSLYSFGSDVVALDQVKLYASEVMGNGHTLTAHGSETGASPSLLDNLRLVLLDNTNPESSSYGLAPMLFQVTFQNFPANFTGAMLTVDRSLDSSIDFYYLNFAYDSSTGSGTLSGNGAFVVNKGSDNITLYYPTPDAVTAVTRGVGALFKQATGTGTITWWDVPLTPP